MPAPVALLCVPCAGASAMMYARWRPRMPSWLQVVPVELPGRGARLAEAFVEDFDTLADQLCHEQAAAMTGRFALFGHSMGALLCHGIAQRLQAQGRPQPLAVVVSGSPAPSRRDPMNFARKGDDAGLVADLRRQGGTPEAVFQSPELMRMTLDALGADYRVCESFRPFGAAGLKVPLHVFAGRGDDIAPDRIEAWRAEAPALATFDWFDGGHFFIRQQEAGVLAALTGRLSGQRTASTDTASIPA
ncbi:thioesterase II family protein [Piscinibacter gummiphilus]|uniref:Thioesterase n=1 Tax=Piscinibacter gummiphilus TaxID=946333 RepID=A0A1W6L7W6_9BURK|nr:alpha/beta fold hydrolase [Piscinibacter gummiphilus]ARN20323.1 thioesterase [Piscinibacter gummiphilus]ATU64995.1 thioesterase [Piscinibacter gummiphilus]GLS96365.1 thioesterase [Piscinibacter gummiphilus]